MGGCHRRPEVLSYLKNCENILGDQVENSGMDLGDFIWSVTWLYFSLCLPFLHSSLVAADTSCAGFSKPELGQFALSQKCSGHESCFLHPGSGTSNMWQPQRWAVLEGSSSSYRVFIANLLLQVPWCCPSHCTLMHGPEAASCLTRVLESLLPLIPNPFDMHLGPEFLRETIQCKYTHYISTFWFCAPDECQNNDSV